MQKRANKMILFFKMTTAYLYGVSWQLMSPIDAWTPAKQRHCNSWVVGSLTQYVVTPNLY